MLKRYFEKVWPTYGGGEAIFKKRFSTVTLVIRGKVLGTSGDRISQGVGAGPHVRWRGSVCMVMLVSCSDLE